MTQNIIKPKCPICNKPLIEKNRSLLFGTTLLVNYECGHTLTEAQIPHSIDFQYESITSKTKQFKLRPYQIEGVKFLESSNGRALIADEQGLGILRLASRRIISGNNCNTGRSETSMVA